MKDFDVYVPFTGVICFSVKAEDEDAAIEAALLDEDQLTLDNAHEWETHRQVVTGNVSHAVRNTVYAEEQEPD